MKYTFKTISVIIFLTLYSTCAAFSARWMCWDGAFSSLNSALKNFFNLPAKIIEYKRTVIPTPKPTIDSDNNLNKPLELPEIKIKKKCQ